MEIGWKLDENGNQELTPRRGQIKQPRVSAAPPWVLDGNWMEIGWKLGGNWMKMEIRN